MDMARQKPERGAAAAPVDVAAQGTTSERVGDLDVQHVGRVQRIAAFEEALPERGARIGAKKHLDHDRSVDDDHRLSPTFADELGRPTR